MAKEQYQFEQLTQEKKENNNNTNNNSTNEKEIEINNNTDDNLNLIKKYFTCFNCEVIYSYHKYSTQLTQQDQLQFVEEGFLFREGNSQNFRVILLGSTCKVCNKIVCVNLKCSLYYSKRFCKVCLKKNKLFFPIELHKEIDQM
eukprot:TRINITY_DN4331_c1_g1_i1.p1 TRINITY_DN4331_c1_g1~~TRINITY_DN4331_c1_g1_i1.p1  ORF type:complete len:144 (-),score=40.04 TRINITY_DN4331_c1_g1_i1:86-517(-)